ncbi:MAG: HDOD domain-containing protein [Gammaproteobacteria bacterium]|nr:HDOD domain-containing protein [Gammaproteobacteria bacterium]
MSQQEYFKFVEALAKDLNGGDIKLPSFPDVVIRIRAALDDPDTTGRDIATILGVDAVLAARVLILANSTYYNPGGMKIEGLEAAIGRVGFEKVRTAAIAYAVEQLHASEGLEPLKDDLRAAWSAGLRLAAMSEVIARKCTKLDADSAFIAGLLHRIGVLYIFTKYNEYPLLLQDADARQNLVDEWAAPIGESIVTNWNFSEEIQETLNPDEVETTRRRCEANLADIVTTAKQSLNGDATTLHDTGEAQRLKLTEEKMPAIMELYQKKLDSLASAVR